MEDLLLFALENQILETGYFYFNSFIKTKNLLNYNIQVCDVVLAATGADLVVLNSGTFRSDQVHPAGDFTMRDLVNVIPMRDPIVVLKVNGNTYNSYYFHF